MTEWQPSEQLVDTLTNVGVDTSVLEEMLRQVGEADFEDAITFAIAVVIQTNQLSGVASSEWSVHTESRGELDIDELEEVFNIRGAHRLTTHAKPKASTYQLLNDVFGMGRVDVGTKWLQFKKSLADQRAVSWDCIFIEWATLELVNACTAPEQSATETATEERQFTSAEIALNKFKFNQIVGTLASSFKSSRVLNTIMLPNWRPAPWIVDKLKSEGINRKFIFGEMVLRPFVAYHLKYEGKTNNLNTAYYHWVNTRYHKYKRLLLAEKETLEKQVNANTD